MQGKLYLLGYRVTNSARQKVYSIIIGSDAEIRGARSVGRLNFVRLCQIFVGLNKFGNRSVSPIWRLEIFKWLTGFWKICSLLIRCVRILTRAVRVRFSGVT